MPFDEIIKEKIENFNFAIDTNDVTALCIIFLIYIFLNYINILVDKNGSLLVILIVLLIIIKINEGLKKNEKFTDIRSNPSDIYPELNTGDFIFFRAYSNDSFYYIVGIKMILPLVQHNYFTHIGMIYKADNGKIYILENTVGNHFCSNKNKLVNGEVIMVDFNDRLNKLKDYRIHIVKTNIHKYINKDKLKNSIEKYKNYKITDINCIEYLTRLLYDSDIIKLPKGILNRYLFDDLLDKSNYNFDIKFEKPIIIIDN
jgi:hypothetical protein